MTFWSRRSALAGLLTAPLACAPRRHVVREDGRVVASLWFSYGGKNREVLLALVQRFNESQSSYRVRATFQGDYFESLAKLRTAVAAGTPPDVTHVIGEILPYLHNAGVLESLDAYDGARDRRLVPALSQAGSFVGGDTLPLVALPFNRSTPVLLLNGSLVRRDQAPVRWADLRALARELTVRTSHRVERWGFSMPVDWWFWVALLGQAGGTLLGPGGEPTLGGEAGEAALAWLQELIYDDGVMRPPPGRDYNAWQVINQDFLAGRAAMICTSTAFLRYLEENAAFPVLAAPLPYRDRPSVPTGGTFFVLVRSAPAAAKEAAWAFLRWMTEAEPAATWASRTGYLPVTQPAVQRLEDDGFYARYPNDLVTRVQLAHTQPWPWHPTLFRIQREIITPRLEAAVYARRSAREVLDEARRAAREWGLAAIVSSARRTCRHKSARETTIRGGTGRCPFFKG